MDAPTQAPPQHQDHMQTSDDLTYDEQMAMQNAIRTLKDVSNGQLILDLDRHLKEIVGKVRSSGNKGKITVAIEIAPADKRDTNTLKIGYEVKPTPPKETTAATFMYPHKDNSMHRDIEGQMRMDLKNVTDSAERARQI